MKATKELTVMKGEIIKSVDQIVEDIIVGTIECWQIEANEDCDLKWQLKYMVSKCFEEIGRDITNERKSRAFTQSENERLYGRKDYLDGKEILALEYRCLLGTSHRIVGNDLNELNYNLHNHKCECHRYDSPPNNWS